MKKQIHRETKNGAYFVREPEVAFTKILTSQLDIKHIFNESPENSTSAKTDPKTLVIAIRFYTLQLSDHLRMVLK